MILASVLLGEVSPLLFAGFPRSFGTDVHGAVTMTANDPDDQPA